MSRGEALAVRIDIEVQRIVRRLASGEELEVETMRGTVRAKYLPRRPGDPGGVAFREDGQPLSILIDTEEAARVLLCKAADAMAEARRAGR